MQISIIHTLSIKQILKINITCTRTAGTRTAHGEVGGGGGGGGARATSCRLTIC